MNKLWTCMATLLGVSFAVEAGRTFARPTIVRERGGFSTRIQRVPVIVNGVTLREVP